MRIVYLGQHGNKRSDDTEGHITRAFEALGHTVFRIHEFYANPDDLPEGDIFLFHKGNRDIVKILQNIKYKKVCWYFDKVWHSRVAWFNAVYPLVDKFFMTDGTWASKYEKCEILRQGIGNITDGKGEKSIDVAFIGSLYEDRVQWFEKLKEKFNIEHIQGVYNEELNDVVSKIKVIVAPRYPQDNLYWSNRPYLIVGSGGFLIHPRLQCLLEEWGDNLVYYKTEEELHEKIQYYLDHPEEREAKRKQMVDFCRKNFTYKQRVQELCQRL